MGADPEYVTDALAWWYEHKNVYPRLHRMALDYLSIPGTLENLNIGQFLNRQLFSATSVDVERTFSQGRLLLSYIRNRLSVQSTRALLCLGIWSEVGYVKDIDVKAATVLPEVDSDDSEDELDDNWDAI